MTESDRACSSVCTHIQYKNIYLYISSSVVFSPVLLLSSLINADFCVAGCLIAYGALLGKVSPVQLMVITLFGITLFAVEEHIILSLLHVSPLSAVTLPHITPENACSYILKCYQSTSPSLTGKTPSLKRETFCTQTHKCLLQLYSSCSSTESTTKQRWKNLGEESKNPATFGSNQFNELPDPNFHIP